jgi:putative peptidoglycan lipid II flippase
MAEEITVTTPPAEPPKRERFVGHANLMSVLTILSRIFGLVRDKTCSHYLGLSTEWSGFWMGFQLPNLFRRIFGEGALTAIFVPTYTRVLHENGREAADRLASATVTLLVTFLGGVTMLGEVILLPIIFNSNAMATNRFAAAMMAIMLPYCLLVCLVALLSAIATVHERFKAQSLSPIILNLAMTLAAILSAWLVIQKEHFQYRFYFLAISVIVAGILQVLMMLPSIHASGVRLRALFDVKNSGVSTIIKSMLPMMIGLSAVQANTAMDSLIAWFLSPDGHNKNPTFQLLGHIIKVPMGLGAGAKLSVAQRLYMLPVGIFGVAMATVIFPHLSKAAADNNLPELKRLMAVGLKKTLFLSIPASAGMILIAKPLITIVYMSGRVTPDDVNRATWATVWFCGGIWAFEAQMVILRVFYALRDTMTPMKVAASMVVLNLGLNLCLVWVLKEGGIAASTTIAATIQSGILLLILRRRLGPLGLATLRNSILKGLLATATMIAAALLVSLVLPQADPANRKQLIIDSLITLPVLITVAAVVYGAVAFGLGMPELFDLPFASRFKRRIAP